MADTPDPTPTDEVNLTLSIPRELSDRLTAAGKERLCSKSVVAAFLLSDGLDRLVPVGELLRTNPPPPLEDDPIATRQAVPTDPMGPPPAAKD